MRIFGQVMHTISIQLNFLLARIVILPVWDGWTSGKVEHCDLRLTNQVIERKQ